MEITIKSIKPKDHVSWYDKVTVVSGIDAKGIPPNTALYLSTLNKMNLLDEYLAEVLAFNRKIGEQSNAFLEDIFMRTKKDFRDFILDSFDWSTTRSGFKYWDDISQIDEPTY